MSENESEDAAVSEQQMQADLVLYSNEREFDQLGTDNDTLLLFYVDDEDNDRVVFDGVGDHELHEMIVRSPYEFKNTEQLDLYQNLVSRARYQLRLYPDQEAAAENAGLSLGPEESSGLVYFVYKRDNAQRSPVKNRRQSPFMDFEERAVVLFREYSFQPAFIATPLWFKEKERNSTIGLVGFRPEEIYE